MYRLSASFLKWVFQERAYLVSDPSAKNHTEATGARTAGTMHGAAEAGLGGLRPSAPRTCADPSVQWVTRSSCNGLSR